MEVHQNRNVLIFKAVTEFTENGQDPYLEQLQNCHLNVRLVNTLAFNFTNLNILRQKLENPLNYSALVFGSPRCVTAVAKAVDKLDCEWENLPIFAVGETTGRIVNNELGLKAEGTSAGHGAALAPLILKYNLSKPVLIPCGNLSRDTISAILRENGVSTDNIQVYETIDHPDLEHNLKKVIENFDTNIIVYFSPSGVHASLPLLEKFSVMLNTIKFVAIGPTTEKALEELGIKVSATASKPNPEYLSSAVLSTLM